MKRIPVPLIILLIISHWCNYTLAQTTSKPVFKNSSNPSRCNGSDGSVVYSGLLPDSTYQVTYTSDDLGQQAVAIKAMPSGELTITGLVAGIYSNFSFNLNGSISTDLTTQLLSNPVTKAKFTSYPSFCAGSTPPPLPDTSDNGIWGTWNVPAVNNQTSGTYTFTPDPSTCGLPFKLTTVVIPKDTATFPFGTTLTICRNGSVPLLPDTSTNGITGTWAPAVVDPTQSGTYVFTATSAGCVAGTTFTVTVNPIITPTFAAVAPICSGAALTALPSSSTNVIPVTGAWLPALDNTATKTYTFKPDAGQCATTTTLTVTVNQNVTPTFAAVAPICSGAALTALPSSSTNVIPVTGTWSPALDNTATTTYTFKPDAGQCATTTTLTITVDPKVIPTFTAVAPICSGTALAALPTTSNNGVTGTWSPALNNTATTTYTFTPTAGQCVTTTTLTITVNQKVTPTFPAAAPICSGATLTALPLSSTNVIPVTGAWLPALNNTATTTYTFTPDSGQCAIGSTLTIQVNPKPAMMNIIRDTTVYDGAVLAPYNFSVNDPAGSVKWNNSNPSIGLAFSGTGTIPSFRAKNTTDSALSAIITTVPFMNGCAGVSQSYKITVLPLAKEVFVPNIFSPNGDGKNDQLFIYGNYIASVNMQIFNQWGQRLTTLTGTHEGWDGKYKGSGQPVGVYLYVLNAVLKDGRKVRIKGSITLIR
jgi:gliding motility-associated-like protein